MLNTKILLYDVLENSVPSSSFMSSLAHLMHLSESFSFVSFAGDFVIVDPISEGSKVKAEISVILYPEQIKYIKEEGKW